MPSKDTAGSTGVGESCPAAAGEVLLAVLLPLMREWDFHSDPVQTPLRRVAGYGLMAERMGGGWRRVGNVSRRRPPWSGSFGLCGVRGAKKLENQNLSSTCNLQM